MRSNRFCYLLISILCGLTFSVSAQAASILQLKSFTNVGSLGSTLSSAAFDPFDTTLGSLDSVDISVNGNLLVSGVFLPNLLPPYGNPSPYYYDITVRQSLFGETGFDNFGFATPAIFRYTGYSGGVGEPFLFNSPINYSLTFDDTTDLPGFTIPTGYVAPIPPASVSGLREDFYENASNSSTGLVMDNLLVTTYDAQLPVLPSVTMTSTMFLTYNYTADEVPVPEPNVLLLLGSGLLMLIYLRRRA